MRRYWLAAHLYLGLLLGGFAVLLGLTGSLLVFYPEIDQALNPHIATSTNIGAPVSSQAVLNQLRAQFPERTLGWRIEMPLNASRPIMARYMKAEEKAGKHFAPLVVTIDPQSLAVTSSRFWGDFAVTWLYDLHYTLLLEETGKTVLAIIGLLLLVSVGSGLYLWWPRSGHFKSAFAWRKNAHIKRRVYDWHKTAGLLGCVFLLVLSVTGVMLEKPHWFESTLAMPAPLFEPKNAVSQANGQPAISLDKAVEMAKQRFPQAEVRWIYTPDNAQGVYQVRLYQAGEVGRRFPKTMVWIEQYTGEILAVRDARQDFFGDTVVAWLHPLHNGEAFGLFGRWLIFFSGFVPLILFVTGIMRWRHKRSNA
ncbi:MAG TPA: PepSY-associated TM helix domain-containing protein [Methylotenera sp.]|nr:PepSY-associated TM helix domain-containing protein [Methylotenera sp.]HPH05985.1 PepSY-associated TM helix domain-containing protein [Methylotenera sp.]HPN00563.1 PepSY-associated TM helix domain-containing protein [Methylotenera sp.]